MAVVGQFSKEELMARLISKERGKNINGFGDVNGEYWLGNEFIHQMTSGKSNVLIKIEATDFQNVHRYIKGFSVEIEANKYKVHTGVFEDGNSTLGRNWLYHNDMAFTTKDCDNDQSPSNCAIEHGGGWWHNYCFKVNPNNHYSPTENVHNGKGMSWYNWFKMYEKALKTFRMLMKEY